jgi:hypothetical protein
MHGQAPMVGFRCPFSKASAWNAAKKWLRTTATHTSFPEHGDGQAKHQSQNIPTHLIADGTAVGVGICGA